jgi:hypothetical protein
VSVFDELKTKTAGLKDKATGLVGGNADKLKEVVGKVGTFVDSKTGGKYSRQVGSLQAKASGLINKTAERSSAARSGSGTTPSV